MIAHILCGSNLGIFGRGVLCGPGTDGLRAGLRRGRYAGRRRTICLLSDALGDMRRLPSQRGSIRSHVSQTKAAMGPEGILEDVAGKGEVQHFTAADLPEDLAASRRSLWIKGKKEGYGACTSYHRTEISGLPADPSRAQRGEPTTYVL